MQVFITLASALHTNESLKPLDYLTYSQNQDYHSNSNSTIMLFLGLACKTCIPSAEVGVQGMPKFAAHLQVLGMHMGA